MIVIAFKQINQFKYLIKLKLDLAISILSLTLAQKLKIGGDNFKTTGELF